MTVDKPIRLFPRIPTPRLELARDDLVPISLLAVLAYSYDLSGELSVAIQRGLNAFPHFAGRLSGTLAPFQLAVEADGRGVAIERARCDAVKLGELPSLSDDDVTALFLPSGSERARSEFLRTPLFAVKLTKLAENACVLGLLVSHVLVDGTGLALFMQHCARHRQDLVPPLHSRSVLKRCASRSAELPPWYIQSDQRASGEREWALAQRFGALAYLAENEDLRRLFGESGSSRWFGLTALLCDELQKWGGYREVALWCDVRGAIPPTYTGNVGCYWHEPIRPAGDETRRLSTRLRQAVFPSKSSGVKSSGVWETFCAIQQAESDGDEVCWQGTDPAVLPVNLVPYSTSGLDFGSGGPRFARALTRNLHGLRISRSVDRKSFVIEMCLPDRFAERLAEGCRARGLGLQPMGGSA